jgi:predicted DsbA family dithiol-disulfide isomerase
MPHTGLFLLFQGIKHVSLIYHGEVKMSPEKNEMTVEIWSDVVCPWCYIGKRRFEQAFELFEHRNSVKVVWRSFELDPAAPRTPNQTVREMLASKYGVTLEEADAMQSRVSNLAAEEGLDYRLDLTKRTNTFDAHRLLHYAKTVGKQDALKERLMRGYFIEGAAPADSETLVALAAEAGLDAQAARGVVESRDFADEVRADEERAVRLGIRGVPFFLAAGQFGASGAQPAEVLRGLLQRAWDES